MDNEKKDNLTYDFDFDNQVVKKDDSVEILEVEENNSNSNVEKNDDLNNNITEKLEDVSNDNQDQDEIEELTDVSQSEEKTENIEKVKTIKILGKEFNYEDFILIVLGLVIIASIFLMPRIMNMFK